MEKSYRVDQQLKRQMQQNLSAFTPEVETNTTLRNAAVALVITNAPACNDEASILLTRRPAKLNQHSGQYALPGGKLDHNETVFDAARRELEEELGLSLPAENILGRLDDYPTRSGFCISPVVIWAGLDADIKPSPDEVDAVFYIPFSQLDSDEIPIFETGADPARPVLCSAFSTLGHRMYAPTAAVMYQFREVVIRGLATRVNHFDQPEFAWH